MSEEVNKTDPKIYVSNLQTAPAEGTQQPSKAQIIGIAIAGVLFIGLIITGAVLLLTGDPGTAAKWRDVFIIFMALEMLVIGVAIVILMVQLAVLINLLQNEIRPILESTNETVNTVKGTAEFLSKNVSEPVIKLNGALAGFRELINLVKHPGE
jgi:predicted tellurium resistance membrane protein TerC